MNKQYEILALAYPTIKVSFTAMHWAYWVIKPLGSDFTNSYTPLHTSLEFIDTDIWPELLEYVTVGVNTPLSRLQRDIRAAIN